MALRVRFPYSAGATLSYSIERLADGLFYDFSNSTFTATPATATATLPASTALTGLYTATLSSTPTGTFSNGNYAVYIGNAAAGGAVIGAAEAVMYNGDDAPDFPSGGGSDPWGTALPGAYTAGEAGYLLGNLLASIGGLLPTHFSSLAIASAGTVTVGAYAGGEDPATLVWAAATRSLTDKANFTLAASQTVTLAASQPDYAPAVAGAAMALTSGERATLAGVIMTDVTDAVGADVVAIKAVTDHVATMIVTGLGDAYQFTADAVALAPAGGGGGGGGGGGTDWSDSELAMIRYRLGIDGTTLQPATNPPHIVGLDLIDAVPVDQDYGGTGNLLYLVAGAAIGQGTVTAYLTSDFAAGRRDSGYIQGSSYTNADGSWVAPIMLPVGDYTLVFNKQGFALTQAKRVVVS